MAFFSRRNWCEGCDPCIVMGVLASFVVGFLVLMGFSAQYINSSPKHPEFQLQSVETTTPFAFTNPETTLNGGLNITFWVQNPYRGAIYNKATVEVYYRSVFLTSSTPFDTLCPNKPSCVDQTQSWLPVTINVSSIPVSDPVTAAAIMSDLRRQELSLNFKLVADFREPGYGDRSAKLRVKCDDVKIGVPTGAMIGGPKNCKVDWSRDHRTKFYWLMFIGGSFLLSFILGPIICGCIMLFAMSERPIYWW